MPLSAEGTTRSGRASGGVLVVFGGVARGGHWLLGGRSRCRRLGCVCVCSILYQRGIYPPESFAPVAKYGVTMMVTSDDGLKHYLGQVLQQLSGTRDACQTTTTVDTIALTMGCCCCVCCHCARARARARLVPVPVCLCPAWLVEGNVQKLVVVVTGVETKEVLERWVFNVETDKSVTATGCVHGCVEMRNGEVEGWGRGNHPVPGADCFDPLQARQGKIPERNPG